MALLPVELDNSFCLCSIIRYNWASSVYWCVVVWTIQVNFLQIYCTLLQERLSKLDFVLFFIWLLLIHLNFQAKWEKNFFKYKGVNYERASNSFMCLILEHRHLACRDYIIWPAHC